MSEIAAAQTEEAFPDFDLTSLLDGIDSLARFESELADVESALIDIEIAAP